jgi:hypothetical protein
MTFSWIILKGKQVCVPCELLYEVIEKNEDVIVIAMGLSKEELVTYFLSKEQSEHVHN